MRRADTRISCTDKLIDFHQVRFLFSYSYHQLHDPLLSSVDPSIRREMTAIGARPLVRCSSSGLEPAVTVSPTAAPKSGSVNFPEPNVAVFGWRAKGLGLSVANARSKLLAFVNGEAIGVGGCSESGLELDEESPNDCSGIAGENHRMMSSIGNSTNIMWHDCSIGKLERQKLLQQKGCVIWITGLSGSGKSTVACALSRGLHYRGKLSYVLDGDNVRHGLNSDLSFQAEDRAENIRRIGEVAKLFADAGVICIASLISPYRKDRDACRALLPDRHFIEVGASLSYEDFSTLSSYIFQVFLDIPLQVCEARDPKGLYKLAREGKIRGFTGIDDPYEPPLKCEIVLQQQKGGVFASPSDMAEKVISYLEEKGYLHA
ncbi:hypothetical protein HHK36_002750 [Tetracentron sinense]|uniref:Adenylyl-sulfate kinase n=1 Tax=Tetracentron sinense TaxID=13715 RepID=A0A834ZX25_TETSI|nr:hypothetical protein HHK36_002750 [Tetracentron sinense]